MAAVEAMGPNFEGLTFFEVVTAAGLLALAEEGGEIAVVEAGLGARLDATRVVPAESGFWRTSPSSTPRSLATPSSKSLPTRPRLRVPGGRSSPLTAWPPRCVSSTRWCGTRRPTCFRLRPSERELDHVRLPLIGPHQGRSAALAAQVALLLVPGIDDEPLRAGLAEAR